MKKRFNLKEQEGETSEEELYDSLGTVLELATTMCNDHENETYHTLDPHEALECLYEIDTPRAHRLIEMIKFYEDELDSMGAEEDYRDDDEFMDEYGEDELPDWLGESKVIKLKESDLHKIVKRVLNESWFRRKKEIASFQDYEDFIGGVDNDLVVYDGDGEFLISRRGELGDEYVIKTYDKERFGEDQVVGIAKGMSKDYKFRSRRG